MSKAKSEDTTKPESTPVTPKEVVYWAPAKRYQIANFQPEIKNQYGGIDRPERPLVFNNHIVATADPNVIAFVESSHAFRDGAVKKCADIDEAAKFTRQHEIKRGIKVVETETVESTVVG